MFFQIKANIKVILEHITLMFGSVSDLDDNAAQVFFKDTCDQEKTRST